MRASTDTNAAAVALVVSDTTAKRVTTHDSRTVVDITGMHA